MASPQMRLGIKINMKKSFVLYTDVYDSIKALSQEEKGNLLDAIFKYVSNGETISLMPATEMAFTFIRRSIDRDTEKWNAIRERNIKNGIKGGRPRTIFNNLIDPKNPSGLSDNPKKLVNVTAPVNVKSKNFSSKDTSERIDGISLLLQNGY